MRRERRGGEDVAVSSFRVYRLLPPRLLGFGRAGHWCVCDRVWRSTVERQWDRGTQVGWRVAGMSLAHELLRSSLIVHGRSFGINASVRALQRRSQCRLRGKTSMQHADALTLTAAGLAFGDLWSCDSVRGIRFDEMVLRTGDGLRGRNTHQERCGYIAGGGCLYCSATIICLCRRR